MTNQKVLNKSYLAPLADRSATEQIKLLTLHSPVTILVNNYKSSLFEINLLKALVRQHNGFAYQPNKNVKARAFKDLGAVLSSDLLDGLVVFTFFIELQKGLKFLEALKNKDFYFLSYFAFLLNGHLVSSTKTDPHLRILNSCLYLSSSTLNFTGFLIQIPHVQFMYCLKKINLILNAYSKSINKGS